MTELRTREITGKFEELIEMLDTKHYHDFRTEMEDINPVDAADFFNELPESRIPAVFKLLKKDTAADVFAELDSDVQERIISAMTDREISVILEDLALDDAVDLVEELPANMVHRIMRSATKETRSGINRFLSYPEDSAGSIMTAEFISLRRTMTCAEAVSHIRKRGVDSETVYVAYVTDRSRVLHGIVPLRALLFAEDDEIIEDIMDPDVICASTLDDRETVAQTISKYGMLALPIVDGERRLVGLVTVDDAMDVMETEATEDIEKMAAILPTDKPYLKTGVWETWRKRVPWLLLLMLSATFTSTILARFETILDAATVSLAVFVPMLTGTGGNASGQTSATIIRGLSLGEIELRDILRVLWKEIRVAFVCGVTVAAACFIKTMLVDFRLDFTMSNIEATLTVCLTMLSAVILAKIMGVLLPLGAKRVGLDPAVMASPFITTVVDTLTILIYVGVATLIMHA
ncbi:MAG: magnesium transporter [Clostridia bacterium]|nr:magnesium transporter [Clostridia bacterium]